MSETPAHRRAKKRAAGPSGKTEAPLPGDQRLDAITKGRGRATENSAAEPLRSIGNSRQASEDKRCAAEGATGAAQGHECGSRRPAQGRHRRNCEKYERHEEPGCTHAKKVVCRGTTIPDEGRTTTQSSVSRYHYEAASRQWRTRQPLPGSPVPARCAASASNAPRYPNLFPPTPCSRIEIKENSMHAMTLFKKWLQRTPSSAIAPPSRGS